MSSIVSMHTSGDWKQTDSFFQRCLELTHNSILDEYGRKGVEALRTATPKDSGKTADSWSYEIEHSDGMATIHWTNDNENQGVKIAVILQYGHGTKNGGYVRGRDYINPALRPIFDELADKAWKEITRK